MLRPFARCSAVALALAAVAAEARPQQHPVASTMRTRWAAEVDRDLPWPEHPRPLLQRDAWQNLNGRWSYAVTAVGEPMPARAQGTILVPFPLESSLSGVGRILQPDETLWYRRSVRLRPRHGGERVLLHFGAVDWLCEVRVDGTVVGRHEGGYDPFTFDVTAALSDDLEHTLLVAVRDPSDQGPQPRGKQVLQPNGIWYTPCSGIWQTVWVEWVHETHVRELDCAVDVDARSATFACAVEGLRPGDELRADVVTGDGTVSASAAPGQPLQVTVPARDFELWHPDHPRLYPMTLQVRRGGDVVDEVRSYFAFRTLSVGKDAVGTTRLLLNGAPLFQFGPLDQGYWPDGIYTPPTYTAMCSDLDAIQARGCNMLRKHVKVESELYYAECDRRGIVVWQDMPSGTTQKDPQGFERELRALIAARHGHPSIAMWVVFNEGWGQHDTPRYVDLVRELDPTRWVANASGWTDQRCGDTIDLHSYPGPAMLPVEAARASVLGEYGGLGLPIPDHTWIARDNWGYVTYPDPQSLVRAYLDQLAQLRLLAANGLSAAVYTQTTDVEIECNGWITYDREIAKIDASSVRAATRRLYEPPGALRVVLPTALNEQVKWRFTTEPPRDRWRHLDFDDHEWTLGLAGFGTASTPGAAVGTEWTTEDLWIRREISLPAEPLVEPFWCIHHDEDVEVYLDGELVYAAKGYTTGYTYHPAAAARALLTPGTHVLSAHCHQTGGGQFLDVGLVDLQAGR